MKECDILPETKPGQITFPPIPLFSYQDGLDDEIRKGALTPKAALRMFQVMLMNRFFEETIVEMKQGKFEPCGGFQFTGATHLSIGQEAVAAGSMAAIRGDDYITSTHRGHGHSIAKGAYRIYAMSRDELVAFLNEDPASALPDDELVEHALHLHLYKTMAELLGKEDGYCRGRGGGMHIADFNAGHLGANAIVGGCYAIGAGAALAQHLLGTGRVVLMHRRRRRDEQRHRPRGHEFRGPGPVRKRPAGHLPDREQPVRHDRAAIQRSHGHPVPGPARRRLQRRQHARRGRQRDERPRRARRGAPGRRDLPPRARAPCSSSA